ncbi:hypothetical protein IT575_02490 [bacterium]|nr:hypothetical protein [bacterium]
MNLFKEELPHLTLYWRRLLRTPARGLIVFLLAWLVLIAGLLMVQADAAAGVPGLANFGLRLLPASAALAAHFGLLYAAAEGMRNLQTDERDGVGGWQSSPIGEQPALRGVLISSLLGCAAPALVLAAVYAVLPLFEPRSIDPPAFGSDLTANILLNPAWSDYLNATLGSWFRLPAYALFAACLFVVVRGGWANRMLSFMLAGLGTGLTFWTQTNFTQLNMHYDFTQASASGASYNYPDPRNFSMPEIALPLAAGVALFVLLISELRNWAKRPEASSLRVAAAGAGTLIAAIAVLAAACYPISLGVFFTRGLGPLANVLELIGSRVLLPLHLALSCIFPTLTPVWCRGMNDNLLLTFAPNTIYSVDAGQWVWLPALLFYSGTTYALWQTALFCLRCARRSAG